MPTYGLSWTGNKGTFAVDAVDRYSFPVSRSGLNWADNTVVELID